MKSVIAWLAVLWLAFPAVAGAGDLAALDAENGFRDARFGETVAALEGLELLSESGAAGTRLYVRADEKLELGDARLDGITYGFYGERLYFVAIFTSGRSNAQAVLTALQSAYGPGAKVSEEAVEFLWHGSRVSLHFRQDPATGVGMAAFTSLPMDAQVKSARSVVPANAAP